MAAILTFTNQEKTTHNSHKFAFTLKPTNYGYWRLMVESFLTSHNLFGYVDGTIPCLESKVTNESTAIDNPSYQPWISNNAHIHMLIISTVSGESFQHIQERAYASVTSSHEFTLKNQLLRITMKGNEKPAEYLSSAQEYATALANIDEPMKDKDLVMLTLAGHREEYNGHKANLLARSFHVNFNKLHGLLGDHDYMITRILATNSQVPQAFLATASPTQQPLMTASTPLQQPNLDSIQQQLHNLQLMASQLGYQLNPVPSPRPHAYFGSRLFNNNRGGRDSRGSSCGNS
ncbi:hypothetical protein OSB04_011596 [Centaurea solstitialis]|uniref:Retrotransposon Copia-like N-terminal domain-containing protein n=1 Tax=Centaurea solstitialis TaxID=347529 RepID=A0AA38WDU3_9ASTR|nr:hypothetical protein OSB04_011596 [Centaurea solstitialis]